MVNQLAGTMYRTVFTVSWEEFQQAGQDPAKALDLYADDMRLGRPILNRAYPAEQARRYLKLFPNLATIRPAGVDCVVYSIRYGPMDTEVQTITQVMDFTTTEEREDP